MTSPTQTFTLCLPIWDRQRAVDFYVSAFDFEPIGPLAEDGIPEPLVFKLAGGVRLMLIPSGGFEWALGDRPMAPSGTSECLLSLTLDNADEVDHRVQAIVDAGGRVVSKPEAHSWGYAGVCTDVDGHAWQISTA